MEEEEDEELYTVYCIYLFIYIPGCHHLCVLYGAWAYWLEHKMPLLRVFLWVMSYNTWALFSFYHHLIPCFNSNIFMFTVLSSDHRVHCRILYMMYITLWALWIHSSTFGFLFFFCTVYCAHCKRISE